MKLLLAVLAFLALAAEASAHFVYVYPAEDGSQVKVVLSERLAPDPDVPIGTIAKTTLFAVDAAGGVSELAWTKQERELDSAPLNKSTVAVGGATDFGLYQSKATGDKPAFLKYYPKAVIGTLPYPDKAILGERAPLEIVITQRSGQPALRALWKGQPVAEGNCALCLGGQSEPTRAKTDADGFIPLALDKPGRLAAWVRFVEPTPGELDGKKYEAVFHYATLTLVVNAGADQGSSASAAAPPKIAELPVGIASFGAALDGDWLYVYGGHTGRTHQYSTEQVSNGFGRVNARLGGAWEELPSGPALQGLVMVSHAGSIYRAGGMSARNKPGETEDLHSLADVARFDPRTKEWTALAPLPEGRSSHAATVLDGKLYVIGGWQLRGAEEPRWDTSPLVLDLGALQPEWKPLPKQPFERRALAAVALDGKIYVLGGLMNAGGISHDTDIFDIQSQTWSKGPPIPGMEMNGNGVAACALEGRVYISGMDGNVYGLDRTGANWLIAGKLAPPRIHHRLVALRPGVLLAVAGATRSGNLRSVDSIELSSAAPGH